jgi:hypothetical protein
MMLQTGELLSLLPHSDGTLGNYIISSGTGSSFLACSAIFMLTHICFSKESHGIVNG